MSRCIWKPPPRETDERGRVLWVCEKCGSPAPLPAGYPTIPTRHCIGSEAPRETPRPPKEPKAPSLAKKAVSLARAMAKHIAAGAKLREQPKIDRLLTICRGCEFFSAGTCLKCGCGCSGRRTWRNKLAISTESCPVGKW